MPLNPDLAPDDVEGAKKCARELSERAQRDGAVALETTETVAEYVEIWLQSRALTNTTVSTDRGRLTKHVLPVLGSLDVLAVSRDDLDDLVEHLGQKLNRKTAQNTWALVKTMFGDMQNATRASKLRRREDNPAARVKPPPRGIVKAKGFLYPSEVTQLLACDAVPLELRRFVALSIYLYARAGEVNALTWDDVDLVHGTVLIHSSANRDTGKASSTKTEQSRRFAIRRALMPLLRVLHAESGGRGRLSSVRSTDRKLTPKLRDALKTAGITRADLFASDASRKQITFHDARATGITWAAIRNDPHLTIMERAGHAGFATTMKYIRQASNLRPGLGEPFPPLAAALLGEQESHAEVSVGVSVESRNPGMKARKACAKRWRRRGIEPDLVSPGSRASFRGRVSGYFLSGSLTACMRGTVARECASCMGGALRGGKGGGGFFDSAFVAATGGTGGVTASSFFGSRTAFMRGVVGRVSNVAPAAGLPHLPATGATSGGAVAAGGGGGGGRVGADDSRSSSSAISIGASTRAASTFFKKSPSLALSRWICRWYVPSSILRHVRIQYVWYVL